MAVPATARFHGRNGRLFVAVAAGGSASLIAYSKSFTIDNSTDKPDVTAFGDTNHTYVVGLPDDKGTFAGFSDIAGDALYTASRDGIARKTYFYPDFVNALGVYFFTTAFWDLHTSYDVAGAASVTGNWVAATDVVRVLS